MNPTISAEIRDKKEQLSQLKNILLREDREALSELQSILNDKEKLSGKVSPIVREHLDFLKQNFSSEYREIVDEIVAQKLVDSQEDLLNVLFPVMGKMIKKFVNHEFQKLKESIDQQIKSKFSGIKIFTQINVFFGSKRKGQEVLASLNKPIVEEVFIIQKDSGLLIAHAAKKTNADADVIAGMFTAIKAFVEDAFKKKSEELEIIEYGTYKLFIQSFYSYYIAAAISGSMSASEKDELSSDMFDFAERELKKRVKIGMTNQNDALSKSLEHQFLSLPMR